MFLFNPENDLALANFGEHYMPPESARRLGWDLSVLPAWYAPSNSLLLSDNPLDGDFLSRMNGLLLMDIKIVNSSEIADWDKPIFPWGWNPTLRKRLLNLGVEEQTVATKQYLQTIRDYSNRLNAVKIHNSLMSKYSNTSVIPRDDESHFHRLFLGENSYRAGILSDSENNINGSLSSQNLLFCGSPHYFRDVNEVLLYLSKQSGDCVLKMPLSGSGKGLVWIKNGITDKQTDWCRRVILNQGGVVAEPAFNRVQDFAMEFFIHNANITFEGYSLFNSASSGAYAGNQLISDLCIEQTLFEFLPINELHALRESVELELVKHFPNYNGYLGVDMMVCKIGESYCVHPCLEVNLRMNMGLVAHRINEQFVGENSMGHFNIAYFKSSNDALSFELKNKLEHPLEIIDGKVVKGFLPLNPVNENTRYIAYALITNKDYLCYSFLK